MNALFQFFTALAVAAAAMAFSHFGVAADGLELRASPAKSERAVKRSPVAPPASEPTRSAA